MTRGQIIATQTAVALTILGIVAVGAMTAPSGSTADAAPKATAADTAQRDAVNRDAAPLAQPATQPVWSEHAHPSHR